MMLQILSYQSWSLDPTFGAPIQVVHNLVVHTLGPIEPPRVHGGFCRQEPHHLHKLTKEKRDPSQGFHEASDLLLRFYHQLAVAVIRCHSTRSLEHLLQVLHNALRRRCRGGSSRPPTIWARLCRVHQHRSCNCWCHVRGYNQLIASKEHQQATFFFFMVKSMVSIHFTKHI